MPRSLISVCDVSGLAIWLHLRACMYACAKQPLLDTLRFIPFDSASAEHGDGRFSFKDSAQVCMSNAK